MTERSLASLKRNGLGAIQAPWLTALHDREVMAPLKRLGRLADLPGTVSLHDRPVMAPLKPRAASAAGDAYAAGLV